MKTGGCQLNREQSKYLLMIIYYKMTMGVCMYMYMFLKIPVISPGLIFVQKAFLLGLFLEGLVIGRNLAFHNGLACQ